MNEASDDPNLKQRESQDGHRQTQEHPVEVEANRANRARSKNECSADHRSKQRKHQSRFHQKRIRTVDQHDLEVDPTGYPRRPESTPTVVAQPSLSIFEKRYWNFAHFETQSRRFEYHFGCVLPSRRRQLNSPYRV